MFSKVPTCMTHWIVFVGKNSGNEKLTRHVSDVEITPAAVFQLAALSLWRRSLFTKRFRTCEHEEPVSNNILIPAVLGFPSVTSSRPKAIGARCWSFCLFVSFDEEARTVVFLRLRIETYKSFSREFLTTFRRWRSTVLPISYASNSSSLRGSRSSKSDSCTSLNVSCSSSSL